MIASLQGTVESLGNDWAIITVGGIGFQVFMPTSTLSTLGDKDKTVKVYTHLHLREDSVALYGFASPEELALFEILISVSGVGPRMALSLLSAMEVEKLAMAIATGNADLLMMVPGIGKKTASRLILELREKIGTAGITAPGAGFARENDEVMAALLSLGYSTAEAARAVATLPPSADLSLEERVKLALAYFGGK